MRRIVPAVGLCLAGLLAGVADAQQPPRPQQGQRPPLNLQWQETETEHYHLYVTGDLEEGKKLVNHLELVYKTYCALLDYDYDTELPAKFTVKLHKDRAEFHAAGAPQGAGAYYNSQRKELVGFYDAKMMYSLFAHEGMHQFCDMVLPGFQKGIEGGRIPMWYSEGIADCIGNSEARHGKLYMCIMNGTISNMRIPIIQDAIEKKKYIPLKDLFKMDRNTFMKNSSLCYAESWSFCHFLMTCPKDEDKYKQIPEGKYKDMIRRLHNALAAGKSRDEAYKDAWQMANLPVEVAELEEVWKKYVMDLPNPLKDAPYLGVRPEAEKSDDEGVILGEVVDDAPSSKGGLQAGDVVTEFNGKPTKTWDEFVTAIRSTKIGQKVTAKIKRGEERLSKTITMEKRGDR